VADRYRRLFPLAAIALLWLASLALPALSVQGGPSLDGADLLLRGWRGASRAIVAWYANPLFFAALALAVLRRNRTCAALAVLAFAVALTSFALEPVLRLRMSSVPNITFLSGVYVWLCALFALALWSLLMLHRGRSRQAPKRGK
jgi:hypothetical protein